MMICRVLRDVATQLRDFDLGAKLTLEAGEHYFALPWLHAIHNGRNRPHIVRNREVNELLVYEVLVCELLDVVVNIAILIEGGNPGLTLISHRFRERKLDVLDAFLVLVAEFYDMLPQIREVLLGFLRRRCTQTFVVFDCVAIE